MPEKRKQPRYGLVLSGGGIRFSTHTGIMDEMARWRDPRGKPWLDRFKTYVGTSAGSLYATFYAAGYTPAQIAMLAELFGDPALGQKLFDVNGAGLASAFLEHDLGYFRGAVRGFALQTFLETVLSRSFAPVLQEYNPSASSAKDKRDFAKKIAAAWKKRQHAKHDRAFYDDLLNFDDCLKRGVDLFLIGVNAYSGQKIVFCWIEEDRSKLDERDERMYNSSKPNYMNSLKDIQAELNERAQELREESGDPTIELNFGRYENRIYHDFDRDLYGKQFPLALAVRASASVPGVFNPPTARRQLNRKTGRSENDVFLDGGVDDNFSLSVATDPDLGNCSHVLGILLGNMGYRLPDPNAANNAATVLVSTAGYFGTSAQDSMLFNARLNHRRITILSAVASIDASLTDTNKIPELIKDGRDIARDFWQVIHSASFYPDRSVTIKPSRIFSRKLGQRVYISPAARVGPESFVRMKTGEGIPPEPRIYDVLTRLPELLYKKPHWLILYGILFFGLLGIVALISGVLSALGYSLATVISGGNPGTWFLTQILLALALIVLVRVGAYWIWRRGNVEKPDG